jgi:D-3-phosphoglycerate dehydrogenase / 2-oxoglutarate reductase
MSAVPVLYGHIYGAPIYELVAAECPPELRIDFREEESDAALLAQLPEYQFVIGGALKRRHFEAARKLRLVQCLGVGYDSLDIEAARDAGVMVATTPEGTVEGVAEHVVLLILAVNKQLLAADRALREGRWLVWQLRPSSFMLAGLTVGLIGLGRIGREVARRLRGFAVELVYHDPVPAPAELEAELGLRRLALDELLGRADIVSVHTPLTPATRGLIDRQALALMKRDAVLINTSRGEVVDQPALIEALEAGRLRGAGLDVFTPEPLPADSPLLALPQVVLTPHIATGTRQAMAIKARAQFANVLRVLRGQAPLSRVV